ncbi:unnamed protein product [Peniophora sp. CBMAI 1063]|nr:unnamed protein product [Peniophora sp. CBMAI 1063]
MASALDTSDFLAKLFDLPTSTGNLNLPGATAESAEALIELLKHNARHNHVYFSSEKRQHNHVMDHLFAAYGLGASPALLKEIYASHRYEQPVKSSPQEITDETFFQHIGDEKYYGAYLVYFCRYLLSHTPTEAIQKFILAEEYNYADPDFNDPNMYIRYWAGIIHPHIHLGYGIEFGVLQQIAEGLAMTAVHHPHQGMTEVDMFASLEDKKIMREIKSVLLNFELASAIVIERTTAPRNFLGLASALLSDESLSLESLGLKGGVPVGDYGITLRSAGPRIARHVAAWYDAWMDGVPADKAESQLALMVEDVLLTVTTWYAAAGWGKRRPDQVTHNSFIAMHFVTSSMFLPNLVLANSRHYQALDPPLPLRSRAALLRGFVNQCAHWYVGMGRAPVPIADFYSATDNFVFSNATALDTRGAAQRNMGTMTQTERYSSPASAWARIWPSIIVHPNEHLVKLIRALGAFSQMYGVRGKGFYAGAASAHVDAGAVDGTLFVRAAALTMEKMGWVAEGEPTRVWEFNTYVPSKMGPGGPGGPPGGPSA